MKNNEYDHFHPVKCNQCGYKWNAITIKHSTICWKCMSPLDANNYETVLINENERLNESEKFSENLSMIIDAANLPREEIIRLLANTISIHLDWFNQQEKEYSYLHEEVENEDVKN